ncbi:MAG: class I SAM-dependent methyltransferase [Chloroflexota bacterium]
MKGNDRSSEPTRATRERYDRLARFYDLMGARMEKGSMASWRAKVWSLVAGPRVLEVGVGTGKNIPYYPVRSRVTAIDLSPRMLARARRLATATSKEVDLRLMDAQHLEFADDAFDTTLATCVFCSVPDPVQGLRELSRVTRPDGQILLLEHVRPGGALGTLADVANPLVVRIMGANINRRTLDNLELAGVKVRSIEDLWRGIVKLIVASPGSRAAGS